MEKQGASEEEQAPPRQAATGAWTEVPKPEKKYIKRLLKYPLPDTRCRRSWSSSYCPPGHPSALPSPARNRVSPALAAAMRPKPSRPGMRRRRRAGREEHGARPREARLMLCSTCPLQGTPQPPHGGEMRCRCLPS